ncbi:MAG: alpha/beta hydrolase-fold protein, partial [Anaerolineae bacterium]
MNPRHFQQSHLTLNVKRTPLDYLLYLPAKYERETETRYPLILFLHGSGERGSDLNLVRKYGLTKKIEKGVDFPFIVIAPQCPAGSTWAFELDSLNVLLNQIVSFYRVDPKLLYLTGLSLGGNGTWCMAQRFPGQFAAIAPICGRGTGRSMVSPLQDTPIWVFHGALDDVVPVTESEQMVQY